jgi:flagellar export protein FliJ
MPRFVFKLEGVLRQRKQIEQQRQREVAQIQQQVHSLEQELRNLNAAMVATTRQIRGSHLTGKLDMAFLAAHRRYSAAMARKGQAIVQRLAALAPQVLALQAALGEAAKRRKAIEKLKERRQGEWREEWNRLDRAEMDEVAEQMGAEDQLELLRHDQMRPEGVA